MLRWCRSAYDLFIEQGYGAVSVRDLARRTQVTSGAIYGHFRNKADLLVAAIADHIDQDLYLQSPGRRDLRAYCSGNGGVSIPRRPPRPARRGGRRGT